MSGTVALAWKRAALTIAWARSPRRAAVTVVSMPATMPDMTPPMSTTERASKAGQASAAAKTADERAESARHAARAAHGVVASARKLASKWDEADDDEKREARRVLREARVIR